MKHLTPEILRAAALRLWDGERLLAEGHAITPGAAVLMAGGLSAMVEFHEGYDVPWSAVSMFADYATVQAARFDFLNLLAASLED